MAERYIVVGGGLAGLMTVIKLAEAGKHVDVFSIVPVKRSHSVCAQGGINGAVNTKGEGDHPDIHVKDTLKGGDFLAEQPPVKGMGYAAPQIIYLLDRMGVPFNRTSEGLLDFRRFGGTLHHRTAFSGASTGQQLLYALDEQVRRYESEGLVRKYEYWEYLSFLKDEQGACRGIAALNLRTMEIEAFPADAVCLATGGPGIVYGRSTNSTINTGSANGRSYMDGAILDRKLGGIMEIYEKFEGVEPRHEPMKIFPAVHYSMGGLWCDYEADANNDLVQGSPRQQTTNIPGLYAAGECDYAYHGANRLGANSLLSCIYAGMIAGPAMISYARNNMKAKGDVPGSLLAAGKKQWDERFNAIYRMSGPENPYVIGQQMGDLVIRSATVVKTNAQLDVALGEIQRLKESWKRCNVLDTGRT